VRTAVSIVGRSLAPATRAAVVGGLLDGCGARRAAPPGLATPALYGAGLFSTGAWDFFIAFSPDEREVL
jgi:hypothetical protein